MTMLPLWMAVLPLALAQMLSTDPIIVGQTFMAASTDPTSGGTPWALVSHGIAEKLFTVDQHGNIVAQIAKSITNIDTFTWDVTLKADVKFSDGVTITAQHVVDALTELNTLNSNAQSTVGTMTVTAPGGQIVRIVTERAHPVLKAVLAEWVFVIYYVKDGDRVYSGPYMVNTFTAGVQIEMSPNPYYDSFASMRPPSVVIKSYGSDELADALDAGEVDVAFHLPIDRLAGLRTSATDITLKSMLVGYHYMMHYNMQRAPMSDLKVRQAVDTVLDRQLLTQTLQGGFGTGNLFPQDSPYYFESMQPQADASAAAQLLEDAGWVLNGQGVREKNGETLSIRLVAYDQRPGLGLIQPVIAQTLTDLGFAVTQTLTVGPSWDELDAITGSGDWDLLEWAQHTLPAGDPQWFLNSFFHSEGGNNHAGINSSTIDSLLETLGHADEGTARVAAARAVHDEILAEVPVSNLMTPSWHVGLSARAADYTPWGADYYIVRADLGLAETTTTTVTTTEMVNAAAQPGPVCLGMWFITAVVSLAHRIG